MRENKGMKVFLYRVTCATENYSLLKKRSKKFTGKNSEKISSFSYFLGGKKREFPNYIPIFYIPKKVNIYIWSIDMFENLKS